jgi:hypothetical protein
MDPLAATGSGASAAIVAALVSGFGALVVGLLNYRGQGRVVVTSRFTQAVGQLGDKNADVRVGAIYALEQILHTSKAERRAIIELLVSYVLGHASVAAPREDQPDDDASLDDLPPLRDWGPDVQAAVVVLSRRPRTTLRETILGSSGDRLREPYGSAVINVGRADLRGADLADAELSETKLYHVRFERAILHRARLKRADMSRAQLQRADLRDTTLVETKLTGANLSEADLGGARLRKADLSDADLRGTVLKGVEDLEDATLEGARADERTKWPHDFEPVRHGVILQGGQTEDAPAPSDSNDVFGGDELATS